MRGKLSGLLVGNEAQGLIVARIRITSFREVLYTTRAKKRVTYCLRRTNTHRNDYSSGPDFDVRKQLMLKWRWIVIFNCCEGVLTDIHSMLKLLGDNGHH